MTQMNGVLIGIGIYVLVAAVSSLPDPSQKFEFYPWLFHTLRQLLNLVPPQYTMKLSNTTASTTITTTDPAPTKVVQKD